MSYIEAMGVEHTHASIPALGIGIGPDNGSIALLEILLAGRLNTHFGMALETTADGLAMATGAVGLGRGLALGLEGRGAVSVGAHCQEGCKMLAMDGAGRGQ